ncbi:MAG: MraY family glycosyltransferase [Candidatus Omnitrophota bacterium]
MQIYAIAFISALVIGIILFYLVTKVFFNPPVFKDKNNISNLGGLVLSLSFITVFFLFSLYQKLSLSADFIYILIFSFIVWLVGFIDDWRELSLRNKVVIQTIIGILFLTKAESIQIYFLPYWANYLISFFWIIGITNVFNLLDIGDGLCGGISLIVSLSFFTVSFMNSDWLLAAVFASLSGALFAFLFFNFSPAKILMGNSGSHFLGFLFAAASMYGKYATHETPLALFVPFLILAFPIIDTAYLVIIRVKKNILPLKKSNDHIFFHFLASGKSERIVLFKIYFACLLWCLGSILLNLGMNLTALAVVVLAMLFSLRLVVYAARSA